MFIHSPTKEYFDYFQFLTVMNKASVNICVQVFVWVKFSSHFVANMVIRKTDTSSNYNQIGRVKENTSSWALVLGKDTKKDLRS